MTFLRLASLTLLFLVAQQAVAAKIETLSTEPLEWKDRLSGRCTHRLSGPIESGDAAALQAAIDALPGQDHDDRNFVLNWVTRECYS